MSGRATADCSATVNPMQACGDLAPPEEDPAEDLPGWWILPFVALGAAFWALIIFWIFGFG